MRKMSLPLLGERAGVRGKEAASNPNALDPSSASFPLTLSPRRGKNKRRRFAHPPAPLDSPATEFYSPSRPGEVRGEGKSRVRGQAGLISFPRRQTARDFAINTFFCGSDAFPRCLIPHSDTSRVPLQNCIVWRVARLLSRPFRLGHDRRSPRRRNIPRLCACSDATQFGSC